MKEPEIPRESSDCDVVDRIGYEECREHVDGIMEMSEKNYETEEP